MDTPTEKFKKWATGWAGIDGGNPAGGLWFCGIEYGGLEANGDLCDPLALSHNGIPCWNDKREIVRRVGGRRLQYDYKAAKVACMAAGKPLEDYKEYFADRLYWHDGETFKLNLYPLSFPTISNVHWKSDFKTLTGCEDKEGYREWCREHRFDALQKRYRQYRPKTLVCTGMTYVQDFKSAFLTKEESEKTPGRIRFFNREAEVFTTFGGQGQLIIVPFFGGRYGMNTNQALKELGLYIRSF